MTVLWCRYWDLIRRALFVFQRFSMFGFGVATKLWGQVTVKIPPFAVTAEPKMSFETGS
jgi:hypothetical protein